MDVAKVKSIDSLRRGLEVLALIGPSEGRLLGELHTLSGIPKASLLRILRTLQESGCVQRRLGDGAYLPIGAASPSRALVSTHLPTGGGLMARLPAALNALSQILSCPSDVAVRHGLKMRVIDSNRAAYGPHWRRTVIGAEVDMLGSALGRAYLAYCDDATREDALQQLIGVGGAKARKRDAILAELAGTRSRGFGNRDALYPGPDADHGKHLSAIAVPILVGGSVVACISCVWSVDVWSKAQVLEGCLSHLVRQATVLGLALETH